MMSMVQRLTACVSSLLLSVCSLMRTPNATEKNEHLNGNFDGVVFDLHREEVAHRLLVKQAVVRQIAVQRAEVRDALIVLDVRAEGRDRPLMNRTETLSTDVRSRIVSRCVELKCLLTFCRSSFLVLSKDEV